MPVPSGSRPFGVDDEAADPGRHRARRRAPPRRSGSRSARRRASMPRTTRPPCRPILASSRLEIVPPTDEGARPFPTALASSASAESPLALSAAWPCSVPLRRLLAAFAGSSDSIRIALTSTSASPRSGLLVVSTLALPMAWPCADADIEVRHREAAVGERCLDARRSCSHGMPSPCSRRAAKLSSLSSGRAAGARARTMPRARRRRPDGARRPSQTDRRRRATRSPRRRRFDAWPALPASERRSARLGGLARQPGASEVALARLASSSARRRGRSRRRGLSRSTAHSGPGAPFSVAGDGDPLRLRAMRPSTAANGASDGAVSGDAGIEDRIADDVAELAVEVEAGAARGRLRRAREDAAGFDKGQHLARRRRRWRTARCARCRESSSRVGSASPPASRRRAGAARVVARWAVAFASRSSSSRSCRKRTRRVLAADREHLEAARPAIVGPPQAPVAQTVGAALEIDLAAAQDQERDHGPVLAHAEPGEHRRRRLERGERPAAIGPRRVVDADAAKVDHRLQRAGERHPHRVEVDLALGARRKAVAHQRRQPPRLEQQRQHDQRGDDGKAATRRCEPSDSGAVTVAAIVAAAAQPARRRAIVRHRGRGAGRETCRGPRPEPNPGDPTMNAPANPADPPMAEPGKRPTGADVGGVRRRADAGVADAMQRSSERADEPAIGRADGDAGGGGERARIDPAARPSPARPGTSATTMTRTNGATSRSRRSTSAIRSSRSARPSATPSRVARRRRRARRRRPGHAASR